MSDKQRRNPINKPMRERSLGVRILAIVIVILLTVSMLVTFLPSFVFADSGASSEEWNPATRRGGDTWNEQGSDSKGSANDEAGIEASIAKLFDVINVDEPTRDSSGRDPLVVDAADILTDEEEEELTAGLEYFREEEDFDIVVLTVYSLEGYDVVDYADIFYDSNNYGGGEEMDGVLILISTEYRDWTMITSGFGITAITDYSLDNIEDKIIPDLSAGNYLDAFEIFADECAYRVREARKGNIIDEWIEDEPSGAENASNSNAPVIVNGSENSGGRGEYPLAMNAGAAGFLGVIVSLFRNMRLKSNMKTVRYKSQARDYIRQGSMEVTESRDRYLYRTLNRIPIARDDDEPKGGHFGGSTIHMSPGGNFHGGGKPGKF